MSEKQLMTLICERLRLKKKYLDIAFEQVAGIKPWRVKQITNGYDLSWNWPFKDVLLTAIELQYEEMRCHEIPNRYQKTKRAYTKYKAQRAEKAEQFKETGRSAIEKLTPYVTRMCGLDMPPMPQVHIDAEFIHLLRLHKERVAEVKAAFCKLSPEYAYVLSRNTEAFSLLAVPEIAEFCHCILRFSEEQKESIKSWMFKKCETRTVEKTVATLKSAQVQQWCRMENPQYRKSFSVQFSKELEAHQGKWTAASTAMMGEAWSKFFHTVDKTVSFFSDVPMDMIKCSKILDGPLGMELMVGFLCCSSQRGEILQRVRDGA